MFGRAVLIIDFEGLVPRCTTLEPQFYIHRGRAHIKDSLIVGSDSIYIYNRDSYTYDKLSYVCNTFLDTFVPNKGASPDVTDLGRCTDRCSSRFKNNSFAKM